MAGQVKIEVVPARGGVLVLGTRSSEVAGLHAMDAATTPGTVTRPGFWTRHDGVWMHDHELHPGSIPGIMFVREGR